MSFVTPTSTSPPRPVPEITLVAGRAFQKGGNPVYLMPTDGEEPDRLDEQHNLLQRVYGSNHLSPLGAELERGCKVLDAGAGTGIWSMEMASTYPRSEFYATDVVDLFPPEEEDVPPNVQFMIADTLKGLPFEDGTFDYVFQRFAVECFREAEWPRVIEELVRVTKPGGWVELVESDVQPHDCGPCTKSFFENLHTFFSLRDINTSVVHSLDHILCTAGLTNSATSRRSMSVPLRQVERYYDSIKSQVWASLGVGEDEFDATAAASIVEMKESKPTYFNILAMWGRKPV